MSKTRNLANSAPQFNSLIVPTGNTAQRPANTAGQIRYNTDLGTLESANGAAWANVSSGSASSGGSGGVSWQPVQNTNFIAIAGNGYAVNTASGNVTVTLPASPIFGQQIQLVDYGNLFSANALIIYPNGNKLLGNTANLNLTVNGQATSLVYTDNNKGWINYSSGNSIGSYLINYLVVAGGGGAGTGYTASGGGAGGMLTGTTTLISGLSYSITVGAGGTGTPAGTTWAATSSGSHGTNGTNSVIGSLLTAIGGGAGSGMGNSGGGGNGNNGGSGGGGSVSGSGGSGTSGQGNPGGSAPGGNNYLGAGGGGASASGGAGPTAGNAAGAGGAGATSSISGSTVTYAGGGGGGIYDNGGQQNNSGGAGGSGGGGNGASNSRTTGNPGTNNTGGGGGGGAGYEPQTYQNAGSGGSGVVIISYPSPQKGVGGNITITGGQVIHTFNSSGTFIA